MDQPVPGFVPGFLRDDSVGLFRADERVFEAMVDRWSAQMLARGLQVDTIKARCGTTDGRTTINAHLATTCTAPVAGIRTTTRMCRVSTGACGTPVTTLKATTKKSKASAVLACTKNSQRYAAFGDYVIVFPAGYSPTTAGDYPVSAAKSFKKQSGICVAS